MHIASNLNLPPVAVGSHWSCPLSLSLLVIFLGATKDEGWRVLGSVVSASDLHFSQTMRFIDLQLAQGQFAAECKAIEMRIGTSKSEATGSQKRMGYPNPGWG